jgi:hypothetical protein
MAHPLLKQGAEGNVLLSLGKIFNKAGIPHFGRPSKIVSAYIPDVWIPGYSKKQINFKENPAYIDTCGVSGNQYIGDIPAPISAANSHEVHLVTPAVELGLKFNFENGSRELPVESSLLDSKFAYDGYIGEQTMAEEGKEAIDFIRNLRFEESGMIHPETIGKSPTGNIPKMSVPGRYKTG